LNHKIEKHNSINNHPLYKYFISWLCPATLLVPKCATQGTMPVAIQTETKYSYNKKEHHKK